MMMKKEVLSAATVIKGYKKQFNDFKTAQDRKYLVFHLFGFLKKEFGFNVKKFVGSNQIILTKQSDAQDDGTILYNSDDEGELAEPHKFEQFVVKELQEVLEKER